MITRITELRHALEIIDEGGIVLIDFEKSALSRIQNYKKLSNPLVVECKTEFEGHYLKTLASLTDRVITITGE